MGSTAEISDEELKAAFEDCSLPSEAWTHRAHVRMAYLYSSQHSFSVALDHMRVFLKAYNASNQVPETIERGYHETITVAFMLLVHDALIQKGRFVNSEAFCDQNPDLLDKSFLARIYSRDRLRTAKAKMDFVEPDLEELPRSAALEVFRKASKNCR